MTALFSYVDSVMQRTPSKPWLRRWWIWGIVATFVAAFSCLLAYNWWRHHQVSRELARLRAAGVSPSAEELEAFYEVPAGVPDATGAWMRPIGAIEGGAVERHPYGFSIRDNYGIRPPPGVGWPDLKPAKRYIADQKSLFDMIDAAAGTLGECRFIRDFSGGGEIVLPHAR